jgi:hypothetical protein
VSPDHASLLYFQVKRQSHLFLFRDPRKMTRADLGPVEASCCCASSDQDTLQSQWQLMLEAAPVSCSMQLHGSSGIASDVDGSSYSCSSNAAAPTSPTRQQLASGQSQNPSGVPLSQKQRASGPPVLSAYSRGNPCRPPRSQGSHSCPMQLLDEARSAQSVCNGALVTGYDWEVGVWSWLQALMF